VSDALSPATVGVGAVSGLNRANQERMQRFLPRDECLTWTGSPQLSRLFLRAITRTGLMALIGSVGIYFALNGITPTDLCGPEPSKTCQRLFVLPWIGLAVAAIYTPFLWLNLMTHTSGLLREFYGLTDTRALKLSASPFDRFQSVKFSHLAEHQIGAQKGFGTVVFGSVAFLCLSDKDTKALRQTLSNAQRVTAPETPNSYGATP
jgi:hypothetical protein